MKSSRLIGAMSLLLVISFVALSAGQRQTVTPFGAAPDFTLKDHAGTAVRLADYRGRVVLLNFWATWCGDCNVEVPWLGEFQRKYGPAGLTVLGVSLDDNWTPVVPAMKHLHMTYSVLLGNPTVTRLYDVEALPITVLIGRDGQLVERHRGIVNHDEIDATLRRLLR
jgi:peroxiredoxin